MKIKELKINGFGKLENKEMNLDSHINIIYGNNEAGKSTLLKFIMGMFYGLSKNKNGQAIPDVEKFTPWKTEEFSGKIKYELDNGKNFEVYRDFKKKNPKIFNENLEDISNNFTIDKTKGSQFFFDQIGLEEDIFTSSVVSKQGEVRLDSKSQNNIIQKISNILGTGEDTTSYTKIVARLKKKINDEIGTNLTKEKPINLIENRMKQIQLDKEELEKYQDEKFDIEEKQKSKKKKLIEAKERVATLKTAKVQLDKIESEQSKINVAKKMIEETEKNIETFKEERKEETSIKGKNIKIRYIIIEIILWIASILCLIIGKNVFMKLLPFLLPIVAGIIFFIRNYQNKQNRRKIKKEYQKELRNLENTKNIQTGELKELENNYYTKLSEINKQYHLEGIEDISEEINKVQTFINELTLELHSMELDYNTLYPKLEKLVNIEEELESLQEEKAELEKRREEIKEVLEVLELSYQKMKEEITPKFTERLSLAIQKISDGKYQKVRMNTSGEIIVETKNGEYINAENLSIGTIDQLYISLRLAAIEEITKETMPIILDEAFAYYDNERLKNILEYLVEEYQNYQIIIFTCTKREKEILEKLNLSYHLLDI